MRHRSRNVVLGVAAGIAAIGLAPRPASATQVNYRPGLPTFLPNPASASPTSGVSPVASAIGLGAPTVQPDQLDLSANGGPVDPSQAIARIGTLSVWSPTDCQVSASFNIGSKFGVNRLIRYVTHKALVGLLGSFDGKTLSYSVPDKEVPGYASLPVAAGQMFKVEVGYTPDPADAGVYHSTLVIRGDNADGTHWSAAVPVQVTVKGAVQIEVPQPNLRAVQGQGGDVTLHLVSGAETPRSVTITPGGLPSGVTMAPQTVQVGTNPLGNASVDVPLHFSVSDTAPAGKNVPMEVRVDDGSAVQSVSLNGNIYPSSVSWPYRIDCGDIHGDALIEFRSDGYWHWHAKLHDNGTLLGDSYLIAFEFNLPKSVPSAPGGQEWVGAVDTGSVGAGDDHEVDQASDKPDQWHASSQPDPWLRDHYMDVIDRGFSDREYVNPDFGPVVKWFVDQIWGHTLDLLG
jgi:hypothetical protein